MFYYPDSFSNVQCIHSYNKAKFPWPFNGLFQLLIKRTLRIFIGIACWKEGFKIRWKPRENDLLVVTYQVAKLRNFTDVWRVGCGVGERTSSPTIQTVRTYIFVSFQHITLKLDIFTDSGQDFLSSRVEGLSLTAGHIKSWKNRGRIYLPSIVLLAGAWSCAEMYWKVSWVKDAHLYRIELELMRTFFIALCEGLTL